MTDSFVSWSREHTPEKHENCEVYYCLICEGGLVHCTVCGGAEASLPTHCPGAMMTEKTENAVQAGELDFRDGKWMYNEKFGKEDGDA